MWLLHGGGTGLKHLQDPGCGQSQNAEWGVIDLGVAYLWRQNGVKGLSHQKGPTCRCGLSI